MQKPNGYDSTKSMTPEEWYDLEELKDNLVKELTPSKNGFYVCPLCGSGNGKNQTGALRLYGDGDTKDYWKCHKCGESGDIVDLVAKRDNISEREATLELIKKYKPHKAKRESTARRDFQPFTGSDKSAAQESGKDEDQPPVRSFAGKLAAWHSVLKGSAGEAYLRRRGITEETMNRFNLGFDSAHQCITFPYDKAGSYYSSRSISDTAEIKHRKPSTSEAGPEPIFNAAALYQDQPCFIVESQLCAISICQEGGYAVAIGGVGGVSKLRSLKDKPAALLILALDNDEAGEKGQAELAEILREKEIRFLEYNVAGDCKDPNELLQKNPEALRGSIAAAIEMSKAMLAEESEKERKEYEAQTAAAGFGRFLGFLDENGNRPPIPTGFNNLDRVLNGGLTAGLYIMGAISSLGKTSWILNIADNIAAAGRDVLYFSLEMSRNELIAKSISRYSFRAAGEAHAPEEDAFSTFEVLNCRGRRSITMDQEIILDKAFQAYKEGPGARMWIFEGVGDFGVNDISQRVDEHIRITGRRPVVFIDYLQILAPEDPRSTDKQNTDKAVVELKRLSAKYDIPIFSISSLNRQNYSEPITMAAFKESGAIEYGSDVLIGIQLYGIGYQPGEKQQAHAARIREIIEKAEKDQKIDIEIKVLKNRNGGRGGSGRLLFNKKYNFFSEVPDGFVYSDSPDPFADGAEKDDDVPYL